MPCLEAQTALDVVEGDNPAGLGIGQPGGDGPLEVALLLGSRSERSYRHRPQALAEGNA